MQVPKTCVLPLDDAPAISFAEWQLRNPAIRNLTLRRLPEHVLEILSPRKGLRRKHRQAPLMIPGRLRMLIPHLGRIRRQRIRCPTAELLLHPCSYQEALLLP